MATHRIIRFPYGSWFSCNHLPNRSLIEKRPRNWYEELFVHHCVNDGPNWRARIFNPILLVTPERFYLFFSCVSICSIHASSIVRINRRANALNSEVTLFSRFRSIVLLILSFTERQEITRANGTKNCKNISRRKTKWIIIVYQTQFIEQDCR